jgi:hypothetical protein
MKSIYFTVDDWQIQICSFYCSYIKAGAHSEHGVLITYDIRAKPVERSELECQIWWFAFRKHTFKVKVKIKQWF